MKIFSLIITLLLTLFCNAVAANSLQTIKSQIENLKTKLNVDQNQQTNLQQQLKKIETGIGSSSLQLQKTQQDLSQQHTQLKSLTHQKNYLQQQLLLQQKSLAQQLRSIYMLGQENNLKILLNQQDPNQLSRMLVYNHYITAQRLTLINHFNQTMQQLGQTEQQITKHTQQLKSLQTQQQQQHQKLQTIKQQRQQLLSSVHIQMSQHQQQLQTLIANKAALERVVMRLTSSHRHEIFNTHLAHHHGKYPWPTIGRIIQPYGASIEQSQLKTNGVLIQAPEGQNVYAIASGQVIFSNWMAGYGLLLIIDHGNGLMSIYGRNRSIYKKDGEHVKAGELIANVGNSGGYSQSALYFGLREAGKAVNPQQWCG